MTSRHLLLPLLHVCSTIETGPDTDLFDVELPYAPDRLLSDSLCAGFFFFFIQIRFGHFFGVRLKIQIELERGDIYGLGLIIDWPPLLKELKFLTNLIVIMMIEDI